MTKDRIELDHEGFLSESFDKNSIIAQHKELYELAYKVNKAVYEAYDSFEVPSGDMVKVFLVSALFKLHKDYQSSILMTEMGLNSQAKILLRSLIEKLFVFVAVIRDNENMNTWYKLQEHNRWRTLVDIKKRKPGLENIQIANLEEEIKASKRNADNISISKWAEMAGMQGIYNTAYNILSREVHISANSIESNIIRENESITAINVGPDLEDAKQTIYTNIWCLLLALIEMCSVFEIDDKKFIDFRGQLYELASTHLK